MQSETALLVDDDPNILELTRDQLRSLGYDVVSASSAEAALDLCAETRIGLLITDLVLPERPGNDLAKELRRRWPDLAVVLVSGWIPDDRLLGVKRCAFLPKPYDRQQLRRAIERATKEASKKRIAGL